MKQILVPALVVTLAFGLIGFVRGFTRSREERCAIAQASEARLAEDLPRKVGPGIQLNSVNLGPGMTLTLSYLVDGATRGPDARKDACAQPSVGEALKRVPVVVELTAADRRQLGRFELACEPDMAR